MSREKKDILATICPLCLGGKYILTTRTASFIVKPRTDREVTQGVPLAPVLQHKILVKCTRCGGRGRVKR